MSEGGAVTPLEGERKQIANILPTPREDQRDDGGIPFSEIAFTTRRMTTARLREIAAMRGAYRLNDRARSVPSQALDAAMRALEECAEEIARLRRCGA